MYVLWDVPLQQCKRAWFGLIFPGGTCTLCRTRSGESRGCVHGAVSLSSPLPPHSLTSSRTPANIPACHQQQYIPLCLSVTRDIELCNVTKADHKGKSSDGVDQKLRVLFFQHEFDFSAISLFNKHLMRGGDCKTESPDLMRAVAPT